MNWTNLVEDRGQWRGLFNAAWNLQVIQAIWLVNILISGHLCCVTMGTTWKSTGSFVDGTLKK